MSTPAGLYDQDFYAWTLRNAELLHQGRFVKVDVDQETLLEESALPTANPFTGEQTLDENYWPD